MAQDGRAVIAAILASILLGFARLASADSACLHCVGNAEVSPFRHYFRSTEGEHQQAVKDRVNTLGKGQTGDADPVKFCTNMCIALAQDEPTGKLLEKYLPESVSKLSSRLKSFVEDSFTVDNKTNSIRRKREVGYNGGMPEEYDFVELSEDDYAEEEVRAREDFPDWGDSVRQMRALPERINGRHYLREHGKPVKPEPRSDCLARQQELLMEVMNVFDQIAEKAVEELQKMIQEEFEREMSELEPFKLPIWWIVGLQQNNLILPYFYREKIQPELHQETHPTKTAEDTQPSPIPGETRSPTTRNPLGSTSRASAVAIAMSDPVLTSWYPYQQPNDQVWYPYQNTIPAQTWYPYQANPSNQQAWSTPNNNNAWYASTPDGNAQVSMSGSPGQPVYAAEDGNKIIMVTSPATTPSPLMVAYPTKPDEGSEKVPKPMGFPETTPVPGKDGLPDAKPMLTGVQQATHAPITAELPQTVGNAQETTPVPVTIVPPQTTPKITGGMSPMTNLAAGNNPSDAGNVPETGLQPTTPKTEAANPQGTTPLPVTTGQPQTTPKIIGGNAQETTPVPVTAVQPQTTPKILAGNAQEMFPTPVTTVVPQTTPKGTGEITQETTPVPMTTVQPQTTPKILGGNAQETFPLPVTTVVPQTTTKGTGEITQETTPVPVTTVQPQTTPKMFGGLANKPKPAADAIATPKTPAGNIRATTYTPETTTAVEESLNTTDKTSNQTSTTTSHSKTQRSEATTHAYPTITTAKEDDETPTPTTDPDWATTQPAEEADSDISTRALMRFNDEVTHPDCGGASPTKRFLPAILKVLKLKAQ